MSKCGNNLDKMTICTLNGTTRSKCECKILVEGKMKLYRTFFHFRKTSAMESVLSPHTKASVIFETRKVELELKGLENIVEELQTKVESF